MLRRDSSNPYIIGPDVQGDNLFGREEVFEFVGNALLARHQNAVVLHGQRRVGKTSILMEIPHRLPADEFHCVYFDLTGQAALLLNQVLYNLSDEIAASLDLDMERPAQEAFRQDHRFFQTNFLPQVYQRLANKRLLLLLDEFDVLSDWSQKPQADLAVNALFPYLRKLLDTENQLAFVFVIGRRLEELPSLLLRIFKGAQSERIWLLDKKDAIKLIQMPARGLLTFQPDAIEAIYNLTSGHPYFTQLVCYELFNFVKRQERNQVAELDIPEVIDHTLGTGETAFVWIWDGFDPGTQLLISAIAQLNEDDTEADIDSIQTILQSERMKLPSRDWRNALQELVEWGLLKRNRDDGLEFAVELVRMWVVTKHPLSKMKTETNEIVNQLFQAAQQAQTIGELTSAIEFYRRVLEANPNHIRAQLGLAATLLADDQQLEAVKAYEDAYWQDPYSSKEGLIAARLAYAEGLEKEHRYSKAGIQYQKILEIDGENRRVYTKLDLLYRQGQTAFQQHDWAEAVRYFERVCSIDPSYEDTEKGLAKAQRALKKSQRASSTNRARRTSLFVGGAVVALILVALLALLSQGRESAAMMLGLITRTPSPTPTVTPLPPPTQTPIILVVTATDTPTTEKTTAPTQTTLPPDEPTPTDTATATSTVIPPDTATPTPTPVSPPESTPTPQLPTATPTLGLVYDAPELLAPDDETRFGGRLAEVKLEWTPINLDEGDFYSLSLRYPHNGIPTYGGHETREPAWTVPTDIYFLQSDGPGRRYEWDVTVYRELLNGTTQPVSPPSETRTFFWVE